MASLINAVYSANTSHWAVQIVNGSSSSAGHLFEFKLDVGALCTGDVLQTACCPPDPGLDLDSRRFSAS